LSNIVEQEQAYNNARGQTITEPGEFGRFTGVAAYPDKKHQHLQFIDEDSKYGISDGFTYPVPGAFRVLLEERNGKYMRRKWLNPVSVLGCNAGRERARVCFGQDGGCGRRHGVR
jgi:hypothetical protein